MVTASNGWYSQDILIEVLNITCQKARDMGITRGVAAVLVINKKDNTFFTGQQINGSMTGLGSDGKTWYDFLAIALVKIAKKVRAYYDSGNDPELIMVGELDYRGCITFQLGDLLVFISYSGGSQDQDVEIASFGLEDLKTNMKSSNI